MSESLAGRAADRLGGACEKVWRAGFAALGARAAPFFAPRGGERVLVVAPHPDDEAAGCAGTLLAHRAAGDAVRILVATDGRRSRALGLDAEEMARRRRLEADAAARAVGAELAWVGLPEGAWRDEELAPALAAALDAAPDLVYAPSRVDFHPEHVRVAAVLARALAGRAPRVRVYASQVPLGAALVNARCDVSRSADALVSALRAHATQWGSLERTLRMRRYAAARAGIAGLVEEFLELSAERYARMHARGAGGGFRSLRYRAFSDPLAYLAGRADRRALARELA